MLGRTQILLAIASLASSLYGCGNAFVKPRPEASLSTSGTVAVGTPLYLHTSWEGTCQYSSLDMAFGAHWGSGPGNTTYPCKLVDHTVSIRCDRDACTTQRAADHSFRIIPTKPGVLRVHATLTPTGGRRSKTVTLAPVDVQLPDRVAATCHVWRDGSAQVDVQLAAGKAVLDHAANVTVRDGAECGVNPPDRSLGDPGISRYRCAITAQDAELEIHGDGYRLAAPVACKAVLPTPAEVSRSPGQTYFVLNTGPSYQNRSDFVRMTRERLQPWGWTEVSIDETAPRKTTIVASKHDTTVEIAIAEIPNAEFTAYTWSYTVKTGRVIGMHELPGWHPL